MNTYFIVQTVADDVWSGTHYTYIVKAHNEQEARDKVNATIYHDRPALDEYDTVEKVTFVNGFADTGSFRFGD